eukprot:15378487-Alexandrium_andersonii.AAC.1
MAKLSPQRSWVSGCLSSANRYDELARNRPPDQKARDPSGAKAKPIRTAGEATQPRAIKAAASLSFGAVAHS